MDENLQNRLAKMKPLIRSILLSLGKRATERDFRKEYYEQEGKSFNDDLRGFGMTFFEFMYSIPDVCRVWRVRNEAGEFDVMLERVSAEGSCHMDTLTIVKKKPKKTVGMFQSRHNQFRSSLTPRQPYSNIMRSSSDSHARGYSALSDPRNRGYSAPTRAPAQGPRPPPKPLVKTSSFPASTKSVKPNLNDRAAYLASLKALPPPMHQNMKPVTMNDDTEKQEKIDTTTESSMTSGSSYSIANTVIEISSDSDLEDSQKTPSVATNVSTNVDSDENWGDDDIMDYKWMKPKQSKKVPKSKVANTKKVEAPTKTAEPPSEKSEPTSQKAETNPFKRLIHDKENLTSWENLMNTEVSKPIKTPNASNPAKDTLNLHQNLSLSPNLHRIFNLEMQDIESQYEIKITESEQDTTLDNYHTKPFRIPDSKLREARSSSLFQVELVEYTSPSQFMFQSNKASLMILTEEMNLHYKTLEHSKHLRVLNAIPGMSVAVLEESCWQRAEIVSVRGSEVNLFFVDSGQKKYVNVRSIRYLEKMFASSPRKCYHGSLFGVKPKEGFWPPRAIMKFMAKTKGKMMYASIKGENNGFYQLSIIDDLLQKTTVEQHLVDTGVAEIDAVEPSFNAIFL